MISKLVIRLLPISINRAKTGAAKCLALMVMTCFAFTACGPGRTKSHSGVDMRLLSVARMAEYQYGGERTHVRGPDDELAVVQVEFSAVGSSKLKLSASECELRGVGGQTYQTDTSLELTLGGGDNTMVWDFVFAVPKTAVLESFRLASATFDLGGIRELEPGARLTPGRHQKSR